MSNINPQNIDGTFPIAGQDNNSQGFRDNFTNTINNFTFSAAELTDLQTYAVLTAPLSSVGQTGTPTNNMNYTYLTKPQLKGAVETVTDIGSVSASGSFAVDWSVAHFQTVSLTTAATMSFASTWPTTNLWTKLRLQVTTTNSTALTLPTTVTVNSSNIQGSDGGSPAILTLAAGTYIFEFSTSNNGSTVTIQDVLRNYDTPIDFTTLNATTVNATGNVLATGLSVFGNARVGLAGVSGGQSHSIIGNITQTSSGGDVYINTTGNVLASGVIASTVTTNTLVNNGNIIIQDPISASSFGSNLTVKGTIEYKTQDQANNFSVNTTTKSLTLAPGGDQFLLLNINANCAIGYNATITQGHQTTVHVKNSAGGLAYVIVPNNNTTTGNAFIGLAAGQVGTFVFTSYNTDAANVMVTVTR